MPALIVQWMRTADLQAVAAIERLSPADPVGGPLSVAEITRMLEAGGLQAVVAMVGGRVEGWALVERHRRDALSLLALAVRPQSRRRGIGTAILQFCAQRLLTCRRWLLVADVPEESLSGQLFLRAMGFTAVAILKEDNCYRFVCDDTELNLPWMAPFTRKPT